jgi:iron complex outermembrane receptor protein
MPTRKKTLGIAPSAILFTASGMLLASQSVVSAADSELDFFSDIPVVLNATRLEQPQRNAPVAVSLIDRETIDSSGAQDVPSLLRLVPGFQMGRITGSRSTITLHGFSDRFQRNMQVLVDGRSVYDPGFGGVLWDDLPLALEDIERIEVIRGPASSLYGANAFAATINIITRHPAEQSGVHATLASGEQGYQRAFVRYAASGPKLDYRLSANYQESDGIETRYDSSQTGQLSLRGNYRLDNNDTLMFSTGLGGGPRKDGFDNDITQPKRSIENRNHYAQLKWTRINAPGAETSLQFYYNYFEIDDDFQTPPLSQLLGMPPELIAPVFGHPDQPMNVGYGLQSERYDLELQQIAHPSNNLRLVWGLGGRLDKTTSHDLLDGDGNTQRSSSRAFFNTECQPLKALIINTGAMLEKYSGYSAKLSPRVSANYRLSAEHTLRLSGGRGIRMPTLIEAHSEAALRFQDGSIMDIFYGSHKPVDPEVIDSVEIGYWGEFPELAMSVDIRLFRNEVSGWIQQAVDPDYPEPLSSHAAEEIRDTVRGAYVSDNFGDYTSDGLELALDLRPHQRLRLRAAAAAVNSHASHIRRFNPFAIHHSDNNAPSTSLSLLASLRLPQQAELSVGYYHIDEMNWLGEGDTVAGFHEWDLRLAKRIRLADSSLRVAGILQNIQGGHVDFQRENYIGSRALLELALDLN